MPHPIVVHDGYGSAAIVGLGVKHRTVLCLILRGPVILIYSSCLIVSSSSGRTLTVTARMTHDCYSADALKLNLLKMKLQVTPNLLKMNLLKMKLQVRADISIVLFYTCSLCALHLTKRCSRALQFSAETAAVSIKEPIDALAEHMCVCLEGRLARLVSTSRK